MSDTWMADSKTPAKATDKVEPGTEIGGYRVVELIGQGGMGTVYLAESVAGDGRVALKVLAPELALNDEFRTRFLREARYANSIEHPNVVRVRDSGEADGLLYMVMDYVEGEDLRSLTADGPLEVDRAVSILGQVAGALDAVHATGVRHRDVKPGNVIVGRDPDGYERSYLTDFGLSSNPVQDSRALTAAGTFVGTYYYAAPEQILGKDIDHRVDVYSLACLLFESLTGQPPFKRARGDEVLHAHVEDPPPSVSERRGDLSPAIDSVVAKGMAKDPDDRYSSCTGLIAAARTALARAQTPAPAAAGSPAPEDTPAPSPVRLRVTGGNAQGTEIEVEDEFLIGRQAEGAGTLGDDIEISRRHARISRSAHGCVIEDLGSTNGTYVNGRRITGPEPLSVGDTVQVGDTTLVVQFEVTPPPTETPVETSPSAVAPPPVETPPPPVETPPPPTEASAPKASVPEASVPEASVPEASIPEASAPEPASAPLDLRLEISAETGEARIHFDEDSEPVTLVYQDGRWRLAPPA